MSSPKPQFTTDYQETHDQRSEFETRDVDDRKSAGKARLVESIRLGLTILAALAGVVILGTSADTLAVYNTTRLTTNFTLSMWPKNFDLRPTVALTTCGAIIMVTSLLSLGLSKIPKIRQNTLVHCATTYVFPTVCLIAGLTSTAFYYGVNTSKTNYSLQTWTCQWSSISMDVKPHWSTLCKESKTALYLSVLIIPLEVLILGSAMAGAFIGKKNVAIRERKGSPALS